MPCTLTRTRTTKLARLVQSCSRSPSLSSISFISVHKRCRHLDGGGGYLALPFDVHLLSDPHMKYVLGEGDSKISIINFLEFRFPPSRSFKPKHVPLPSSNFNTFRPTAHLARPRTELATTISCFHNILHSTENPDCSIKHCHVFKIFISSWCHSTNPLVAGCQENFQKSISSSLRCKDEINYS